MARTTKICATVGFCLLAITLLFHILAMIYPRWKIYDHRRMTNETMFIGLFDRCEKRWFNSSTGSNELKLMCNSNKYCFPDNNACLKIPQLNSSERGQSWCNDVENSNNCSYSPIAKGLISLTIVAACTLGISLFLIFLHLLLNQFKYKIHVSISIVSIGLLVLGFLSMLATLILFGVTIDYDLCLYRYNSEYLTATGQCSANTSGSVVKTEAKKYYETRLDLSGVFEIIALVFSSFTIATQIIYLISLIRNRVG